MGGQSRATETRETVAFRGDLDAWLRDVVGPRLDATWAAPETSLTADQVRARLFGKP